MGSASKRIMTVVAVVIVLGGFIHSVAADTEANKAIEQRVFEEIWNEGALDVADEIFAPDVALHGLVADDLTGPEAFKQVVAMYRAAIPDIHWSVDDQVAEGDMVVTRLTGTGTQQGELMGIPPTGLSITVTAIAMVRVVDGLIQESWNSWDEAGLLQQLGVVQPARPGPEDYQWDAASDITGDPGDPVLNKLLVLRIKSQFWNGKDIAGLDETHHTTAIGHDPSFPGEPSYESYRQACLVYQTAFPDLHVSMDTVIAESDKVAVHWTATGTHQGELLGVPVSGNQVTYTGITIYRLADGKVAETWWAYDGLGVMQQVTSPPALSPVGVWVLSIPTPMGNILMLHNNHAQDATGTRFGGTVVHVNDNPTNFGMFPEVDGGHGWVSQTVRTGPDTFATTMLEYGTKSREYMPHELATIGISSSTWQLTDPDTKEGQATYAVYLASQDADGDGFPDEGEEPISCTAFTFTGRRLQVMPQCELMPLPEGATQ